MGSRLILLNEKKIMDYLVKIYLLKINSLKVFIKVHQIVAKTKDKIKVGILEVIIKIILFILRFWEIVMFQLRTKRKNL